MTTPPRALMIDEIVAQIMCEGFLSITSTVLRPGAAKARPRDPTSYLLAITAVSRTWRSIAMEQSRLWSVFYLDWPSGQREAWLRRARNRLLDVCVGGVLMSWESFEEVSDHRFRSLSLPRDLDCTYRIFEELDDHAEFPLLDTILIRWVHDGGRNPWQSHWGATRTEQHARRYPSLRTLELGRICSHNRSLLVVPPSVARLELSSCGLHQNETLTEVCTRLGGLETLILSGYDCPFFHIPSPPPITFDVPVALSLHTLVLGPGLGPGVVNFFADSYHYPLLRTLYIVSSPIIDHLGNLIRGASVTTLGLEGPISFLRHVLTIAIVQNPHPPPIHTLYISIRASVDDEGKHLTRTIPKVAGAVRPTLRRVSVSGIESKAMSLCNQFRKFRDKTGLKLEVDMAEFRL